MYPAIICIANHKARQAKEKIHRKKAMSNRALRKVGEQVFRNNEK